MCEMVSNVSGGSAPAQCSISDNDEAAAVQENPNFARTRSDASVRAVREDSMKSAAAMVSPLAKNSLTTVEGE